MDNKFKRDYYNVTEGLSILDVITHLNLNFCLGNVFKYVTRAGKKSPDPLKDLNKAKYYLEYEIRKLQKEEKSE